MDSFLEQLRYLPLTRVRIGPVTSLGPAGYRVHVLGSVGTTAVRFEVLLTGVSGGSWYLDQRPRGIWLGRVFAAQV